MVQIEELGKVIAPIIFNRNSNDGARKNRVNPIRLHILKTG